MKYETEYKRTKKILVGTKFSTPVQTDHGAHPAFCIMGNGSFSRWSSDRSVVLTNRPIEQKRELKKRQEQKEEENT
jgi:ribosomal protein L35